jgi:putative cell wall-binding protein
VTFVMASRSRRVLIAVVTGLIAVLGLAFVVRPASGTTTFALTRIAGADRYATSALVAEQAFPSGSGTVILATGATYPDALAASFLAGNEGAPILLTTPDLPMSVSTLAAISQLKATTAILLGGTSAISQAEQAQLAQTMTVTRIAGATRYDTAEAINTTPGTAVGSFNGLKTAFIATGTNFPDALGAGPVAYAEKFPIILTDPNSLSPEAQATLTTLGIKQVLILGGTAAVSAPVEAAINALGISTLERFSGSDRSQTSTLLADYAVDNFGFKDTVVNVASGDEAYGGADALSLGPLGGTEDPVPTIVTDAAGVPGSTVDYAAEHSTTLATGAAVGGTDPLPDSDLSAIDSAGQTGNTTPTTAAGPATTTAGSGSSGATGTNTACGTATTTTGSGSASGAGATQGPDLESVSMVSIVSATQSTPSSPAGTTLGFTFSKLVNQSAPAGGDFELIPFDPPPSGMVQTGTTATLANGEQTVDVLFPGVQSQDQLNQYTVAEVETGAVEAPAQAPAIPTVLSNPPGDAPIGSLSDIEAGHTDSADLVSAASLRPAGTPEPTGSVAIDLTFDCGAVPTGTGSFNLVLIDNHTVVCTGPTVGSTTPSGQNQPGGAGTDIFTIVCPEESSGAFVGTQLQATDVARVYMAADTVADEATGDLKNPLESVLLTGGSNETGSSTLDLPNSPDLTSVSMQPNQPQPSGPSPRDEVTYNFDQSLFNTPVTLGDFVVYREDGTEVTGAAVGDTISGDSAEVLFPQGTLVGAVGASVRAGAVEGIDGVQNLPASASGTGSEPSGVTDAPNLTGVTEPATGELTFTFDRPITVGSGDITLYENDPGQSSIACTGATVGTGTADDQLTCDFTPPVTYQATLAVVAAGAVDSVSPVQANIVTFSISV